MVARWSAPLGWRMANFRPAERTQLSLRGGGKRLLSELLLVVLRGAGPTTRWRRAEEAEGVVEAAGCWPTRPAAGQW